jgi:hypothetical protein|tara:strand:- start:1374 stop:2243 length:870 start_codon:yes stop_codon:yes gene_type:complete
MDKSDNKYSVDLLDIVRGYSVLATSDSRCYFKHLKVLELLEFDDLQEMDISRSIKSGIKSEKDLVDTAIKRKFWSVKKEDSVKSLKWTIKKSLAAMGKISDPKQKEIFQGQITKQEKDLKYLEFKRSQLTYYSAEHLAEAKRIKRMFKKSVFIDLDFTEFPSPEQEISATAAMFKRYAELNNRENILKASYFGGFFDLFVTQEGNPLQLLGKNFEDITNFQKYLIVISHGLFNKIKNTRIPEEVYGDPVRMMDYEEKEEVDSKVSHGLDDLRMKSQARGGKLKAEDFLS